MAAMRFVGQIHVVAGKLRDGNSGTIGPRAVFELHGSRVGYVGIVCGSNAVKALTARGNFFIARLESTKRSQLK